MPKTTKRMFCYYLLNMPSLLLVMPFWLLFKITQRWRKVYHFEGIEICDLTHQEEHVDTFGETIIDALQLIQCKDPRRFGRVKRECKFIINAWLRSEARYQPVGKACLVCLAKLANNTEHSKVIKYVACAIVYEATRGVIESAGISLAKSTKARIQQLCRIESLRFARRLGD